jgi:hypothetical protein
MAPIIKEYAQILNFLKVYFRQRIGDTDVEITKLLHLNKIGQYRTTGEVLSESLLKLG